MQKLFKKPNFGSLKKRLNFSDYRKYIFSDKLSTLAVVGFVLLGVLIIGFVFSLYRRSSLAESQISGDYISIIDEQNSRLSKLQVNYKAGDYFEYRENISDSIKYLETKKSNISKVSSIASGSSLYLKYTDFLNKNLDYLKQLHAMVNNLDIIKNADYSKLNVLSDTAVLQTLEIQKEVKTKNKLNLDFLKQSPQVEGLRSKYLLDAQSKTITDDSSAVSQLSIDDDQKKAKELAINFMNKYVEGVKGVGSTSTKLIADIKPVCSSSDSTSSGDTASNNTSNNSTDSNSTNSNSSNSTTNTNNCKPDPQLLSEINKQIDDKVIEIEQLMSEGFKITFNTKYQFGLGRDFYYPSSFNIVETKKTKFGFDVVVKTVYKYQADRNLKDQFATTMALEIIKDPSNNNNYVVAGQHAQI